ncbi:MAG: FAD-binding protein [Firmicutes bacterium]|nr:FAD-binding protein [Bacillota bacterium]
MIVYSIINSCTQDSVKQEANIAALAKAVDVDAGTIRNIRISGDMKHFDVEYILESAASLCQDADVIMLPGNDLGNRLAVSLGQVLEGSGITGVLNMDRIAGTVSRKVYAGNLAADYELGSKPWCISADWMMEDDTCAHGETWGEIICDGNSIDNNTCVDRMISRAEGREDGLADADFILACGQGLKKKANVEKAAETAAILGAQTGASRPVVMNAWSGLETLIGVSGSVVRPKVCITAAASGAPAFFAGIEKSSVIISINSDENAPIMKKSDLAVVGDATEILAELGKLIED